MAAYPDEFISRNSTMPPDKGTKADLADDNTIKYRNDGVGTNYALLIIREWVTQEWFDDHLAWIATNGDGPHTLTLKGIDLEITLINEPEIASHKGHLYMVHEKALAVRAVDNET